MTVADPSFNQETNTISIPVAERRDFRIDGKIVDAGEVKIVKPARVSVRAKQGYKLPQGTRTDFNFVPGEVVKDKPIEEPVVVTTTPVVESVEEPVTVETQQFNKQKY